MRGAVADKVRRPGLAQPFTWQRVDALQQQFVDARAIQIHHFNPPRTHSEMLADSRDAA